MKTIKGTFQYANSQPVAGGSASFLLNQQAIYAGSDILAPKPVTTPLDISGALSVSLPASDELNPEAGYQVTVYDANGKYVLQRGFSFVGSDPIQMVYLTSNVFRPTYTNWSQNIPSLNSGYLFDATTKYIGGPALKTVTGTFQYQDGTPVANGTVSFSLSQDCVVLGFAVVGFSIDGSNNLTVFTSETLPVQIGQQFMFQGFTHTYLNGVLLTVTAITNATGNQGNQITLTGLTHGSVSYTEDAGTTTPYTAQISKTPIVAQLDANGNMPVGFQLYGNDYLIVQSGLIVAGTVYNVTLNDSGGNKIWSRMFYLSGLSPISLNQLAQTNQPPVQVVSPFYLKIPKTVGPTQWSFLGTPSVSGVNVFNSGALAGTQGTDNFIFTATVNVFSGDGTTPEVSITYTDPNSTVHSNVSVLATSDTNNAAITSIITNVSATEGGTVIFTATPTPSFVAGQRVIIASLSSSIGLILNGLSGAVLPTNLSSTQFSMTIDSGRSARIYQIAPGGPTTTSDSGVATRNLPLSKSASLPICVKSGTDVAVTLSGESGSSLQYGVLVSMDYTGN